MGTKNAMKGGKGDAKEKETLKETRIEMEEIAEKTTSVSQTSTTRRLA